MLTYRYAVCLLWHVSMLGRHLMTRITGWMCWPVVLRVGVTGRLRCIRVTLIGTANY